MGTIPTSPWYYLNDSVHLPRFSRIIHRCARPGDTVVSFLVIELHLLRLPLLLLRLVTKSLLQKRTTQQQIRKEIPMSPMLLSEYLMEPPRHITLMPQTGQSAKALALVQHRPTTILPAVLPEVCPWVMDLLQADRRATEHQTMI
ncbi:hypothetical protein PIB30_111617, partial [Stylosanthes scabra]|nr:hypothetical protein [Stylosanthes scabra]